MSGINSVRKVDRDALKQYRIAIEDEGFDFGQSFNLYKQVGRSKVRTALPTTKLLKNDIFKFVGDIEEDYNEPTRMGDAIRNPSAPPDDFSKMMDLIPSELYKKGVLESKDELSRQYVKTALQKFSNGRLAGQSAKDAKQGPSPGGAGGGPPAAGGPGHNGRDGPGQDVSNALIPPQVVVDLPDGQSHDMAGIFQAALKNWRGSMSFMHNPQFMPRKVDKPDTIVLDTSNLSATEYDDFTAAMAGIARPDRANVGRSGRGNPARKNSRFHGKRGAHNGN